MHVRSVLYCHYIINKINCDVDSHHIPLCICMGACLCLVEIEGGWREGEGGRGCSIKVAMTRSQNFHMCLLWKKDDSKEFLWVQWIFSLLLCVFLTFAGTHILSLSFIKKKVWMIQLYCSKDIVITNHMDIFTSKGYYSRFFFQQEEHQPKKKKKKKFTVMKCLANTSLYLVNLLLSWKTISSSLGSFI